MAHDETSELQALIDRMRQGDATAHVALLGHANERLCSLAGTMLRSFPNLKSTHDAESVLNNTYVDLSRAIAAAHPPTVADFFRLAAFKIRQTLLDMAAKDGRRHAREGARLVDDNDSTGAGAVRSKASPATESTWAPEALACWTDFHEHAGRLPEDEREVFYLRYYVGLDRMETASILGLEPHTVSRLWVKATERLAEELDLTDGLLF